MKTLLFLAITLFSYFNNFAQSPLRNTQPNNNGWFMYFGDHKFSEHWGIHLEAQLRRNEIIAKPLQLLLRTGVNYHFAQNAFVTAGYCYVHTSPYGVFPNKSSFPENRFWEQLQVKSQVDRIETITRLRFEQRFSKLPVEHSPGEYAPGDDVYTNRARILIRLSVPFKGKVIEDKSLYLSCYNEAFINFGENVQANIFDQNRAYAAIGYKIPKWGRLEIGYMNQLLVKADGVKIENNHTLQVGFISTLDFRKNKD